MRTRTYNGWKRLTGIAAVLAGLVLLSGCAVPSAAKRELGERLDEVLYRHADSGARVAVRVVELDTGRELYARLPDTPFTPASNMKVVVSAAGLDQFGADHEFATYLALEDDDLWVIGTGDPATGDPRLASEKDELPTGMFDRWADALEERGIKRIKGDLVYDDHALDKWWRHPAWRNMIVHWYAAAVSGLNFNDNCVDITIMPTQPGQPVSWTVMPPVQNITVINNCVTGGADAEHNPNIEKRLGSNTYVLSGTANEKTTLKSKPVEDPGAFFVDAFRTHLASRGITIAGESRRADKPAWGAEPEYPTDIIATHKTPMPDVIRRINANSQNMFADALLKMSGQHYAAEQGRIAPGSWEDGSAAVRKFIRDLGINDLPLFVDDGSGLSRQNKVTARLITDLFIAMSKRADFDVYRDSMAISGKAGSLSGRMQNIAGRVFGKTGYIGGVRALSGYLKTDAERWLVFSIIYNDIPGSIRPFEVLQDEAVTLLSTWPDLPAVEAEAEDAAQTAAVVEE